ncbi:MULTISPECIES: UDP-N-acetylmuramoyl-tripeptide--D-alanyl-D-alanine ligase [unclassified Brevibacillus]|uniref:UDP-N-acetylmuramoyl-tripeptide--D-alanyl-D- alanine ligase n=1 Tax=unclassified Brevibacillus TaxID=2684853 RepID=UPI00156BBA5C|nr:MULTISPECIES: UDP-N-acetylmuramoyl-tripeptide--D-alanyl-D-alanine ligase [unclassified Brevibacillus]MDH6352969.1 UDP-N-acetylmuramoyl-tripeptide--D-alanyl-D-alanine ligase [Brevibacillus sp. 1238]NRQ55430.1 UDP-N-acetylmuramoyl-tripeptide--D-alanyl-D-alanine ligase [Brevibacillus sp. HD1.4A]UED71056.1 UDP-N-acetylmuramoyl-tripeptide--D-alanyl-D-alanine ligase [Brevibacillus sp. HD3.3A]
MKPLALEQATINAEGLLLAGSPHLVLSSVHFDTRQLKAGSLFVALTGGARDGHDFLLQAAEQGAVAALVSNQEKIPAGLPEEFGLILVNDTLRGFQKLAAAYRKDFAIPHIAITGSIGKTTVKDIVAHVLEARSPVYKTYKNLNNHLGVPLSLLQMEPQHQAAVLELGMNHAGEIDLLASLVKPEISVITYIGESHLEFFGTREKLALAKAELLPHTAPDGLVLLNKDSEYLPRVAHLYAGEIMYYSVLEPCDIWAEHIQPNDNGTQFDVCFANGERFSAFLPLHGKHSVLNALPAIAIAKRLGMDTEQIVQALSTVKLSAMRFEQVHSRHGSLYISDAYNASPSSMEAAARTFAELFPGRKKVLVLGDMYEMGEQSAHMHAGVGEALNDLVEHIELLVTVGEDTQHLHRAYNGNKLHVASKPEALAALLPLRDASHAFLFKASRGMELWTLLTDLEQHE